jgi:hypothetical protein
MDKKQEVDKKLTKTAADVIWDDIKGLPMDIFALPGQTVAGYFQPITIEPTKLYLKYSVSAALGFASLSAQAPAR